MTSTSQQRAKTLTIDRGGGKLPAVNNAEEEMAKLWQKDYQLNALVEKFTVGEDWKLDRQLLTADALASIAHARMLQSIDILTEDELSQLQQGLRDIIGRVQRGEFEVRPQDEDGHTAIENALVESLGEAGKKIHTGRSRNDQVLTALRVWTRDAAGRLLEASFETAEAFLDLARAHRDVPLPGRTHMQIAMPASVGLWAGSFTEELQDGARHLQQVFEHVDQSPLGSAASYGVPLPLDRQMTADLLGFRKLQQNVLYANNTRGKFELMLLDAAEQLMLSLSKAAQDLILFSLPEFGYFTLPKELCSGSSIMPQKRNPDMLELIRGKSATLSGYAQQIKQVIRSLPSGYNRDFQETKEPFLRGVALTYRSLKVMSLTVGALQVHPDVLEAAMPPEIYATDAALEKVQAGMSFRDAYLEVGTHLEELQGRKGADSLALRSSEGAPGNLGLDQVGREIAAAQSALGQQREANRQRMEELAGGPVEIAPL